MRALLMAFALAACAQGAGPTTGSPLAQQIRADLARLDHELSAPGIVAAGINETADLGGGLVVRPLEIVEDSRCAANVQCVWEGRLRLRALVNGAATELTLGQETTTSNGAFEFAIAKPGPWADWPENEIGAPPAYRFGFRRVSPS